MIYYILGYIAGYLLTFALVFSYSWRTQLTISLGDIIGCIFISVPWPISLLVVLPTITNDITIFKTYDK